jgi:hypothetical protein
MTVKSPKGVSLTLTVIILVWVFLMFFYPETIIFMTVKSPKIGPVVSIVITFVLVFLMLFYPDSLWNLDITNIG